ncbi:tRNA pseudouridine(55) synthase TruB [Geofilum rubicundum]|uniref:tRNA pseudouridine synthase B n=1 Tax=Geofilum rubicundum JCM 15548 TaxID=1236989 RepID=A0A0E9LXX1_9BACT|nr:tRNA pseudouridine(55) synthase TruB [Geofilum rubicundum]GAO29725.1 tRNA pseudouridine synthase B [Geofilum rubicundum JCM 15548]
MEELLKTLSVDSSCRAEDFLEGRALLINKPYSWSSFDVVNKIRIQFKKYLGIKKIKVGHAGTLDPLASGLLIICTGKATKTIDQLMGMDKEYVAHITFGASTPSYDLETEPDQHFETDHITKAEIQKALQGFQGIQMQAPPVFSAIKKDGQRAYEQARKGKSLKLDKREVEFKDLELLAYTAPTALVRVVCSKGTYIRSFAHDLGKALHSGAHLSGLERTAIGPMKLDGALSMEQFEKLLVTIQTI